MLNGPGIVFDLLDNHRRRNTFKLMVDNRLSQEDAHQKASVNLAESIKMTHLWRRNRCGYQYPIILIVGVVDLMKDVIRYMVNSLRRTTILSTREGYKIYDFF